MSTPNIDRSGLWASGPGNEEDFGPSDFTIEQLAVQRFDVL
jgi:hypothetical protein